MREQTKEETGIDERERERERVRERVCVRESVCVRVRERVRDDGRKVPRDHTQTTFSEREQDL